MAYFFNINLTLFDLETQNLKVRSITETVLEKLIKEKKKKNCLEPDAFLDKQYCENWRACNFCAIWVRMLFFLIDVDIGCSFSFKNVFGKYDQAFPKNP